METISDFSSLRKCKSSEISETWEVLDILTDNLSFSTPEIILSKMGTTFITELPVLCAQNTLISIDCCVQKAFLSDAFVLARKYRDDLMMCLYLFYKALDIEKDTGSNSDGWSDDSSEIDFYERILNYAKEKIKQNSQDTDKVIIQNWDANKYSGDSHKPKKLRRVFCSANYTNTFKNKKESKSEKAQSIKSAYDLVADCWKNIDSILNDYVHVNSIECIKANGYLARQQREELSNVLFNVLRKITVIFLSLLSMIHPSALSANDYVFTYEITGKFVDGLQYEVPLGIVNYLQKYADQVNPGLLKFIQETNSLSMKIRPDT